jgi:hypothetical protein
VDNVTDGDGKEFFSITTEDGNVFYLIVDRQRNSENVYLLNAVTEQDLMSLAKPGDGLTPPGTQNTEPPPPSELPTQPEPPPTPEANGGGNGSIIFIIIAVVAIGGAGYYFKIVRPKRSAGDDYDDEDFDDEGNDESFNDDTEVDTENEGYEGDDEE